MDVNTRYWEFSERDGQNSIQKFTVEESNRGTYITYNSQCEKQRSEGGLYSGAVSWLRAVFLPIGYPDSVSPDYLQYQVWDTLQAYCSSVAGAVSLHATLGSLGVGQGGVTPLAATLTWLTNTGAGMVAGIAFTYCKGGQLDCNNKQWRLFADVTNDLGHLLKLCAPLLPCVSLTLSAAAVLYAIVGVAGGATRAALTAHQARKNNLADVSAKDGSQESVVNLTALVTSLWLLPVITPSLSVTWCVFLLLLCAHLYCNYRAVRAVVAPSINRPRLLLLLTQFSRNRSVPSLEVCNGQEQLVTGPAFRRDYLCPGWRLEVGCSLGRTVGLTALTAASADDTRNYMLFSCQGRVFVPLRAGATNEDILTGCYAALLLAKIMGGGRSATTADLHRAREKAEERIPALMAALRGAGWQTDQLHLGVGQWRVD